MVRSEASEIKQKPKWEITEKHGHTNSLQEVKIKSIGQPEFAEFINVAVKVESLAEDRQIAALAEFNIAARYVCVLDCLCLGV